ncbi:hypothetical protein TIFTF001_038782 [Ficus carica]|uniref:F-box domain-containing protein n=1 Tax=Ficus carica TaxID=3494 RepID=A0AA88EC67_FICCA|nr:hypothetical protein TIFTF001_038782 [Ficus carica]
MSTTEEAVVKRHYIIEDVMLKILQQLPVKSLLRFKCVSKSWYNVINSPTFIAMHHHRSESDYTTKDHKDHFVSLFGHQSSICFFSYDTFEFSLNLSVDYPCRRHSLVSIVGSCNGLLCLWDTEYHYLMNPATRDVKRLAKEPALPHNMHLAYGFGFDPKAETYKLEYSNERWSRAVMKNVAHWCVTLEEEVGCVTLEGEVGYRQLGIAAFDFSDQVFKDIIRIPESLKYRESCYCAHRCCVVKDCLSMGAMFEDDRSIELLYRLDHVLQHPCRGVTQLEFGLRGEALVYEVNHLLVLHPSCGKDFKIVFGRYNALFKGIFVNYRESLLRVRSPGVRKLEAKLAEEVKKKVNSLAEKETKGLIKEILPPSLPPRPPLYLANPLYFKGEWKSPFDASTTRRDDFHLVNGITFATRREQEFLNVHIFLPNATHGLARRSHQQVRGVSPLENGAAFEGVDSEDEIFTPFSSGRAHESNSPFENFYVDSILHKAFIEVNEEGTEAAAVTIACMRSGGALWSFMWIST